MNKKIPLSELKDIIKSVVRETLNERKDKWIEKAVDPNHKGYCTPMTKATCTPARKALAKRFKKGDIHADNVDEAGLTSEGDVSSEPNQRASNAGAQYKVTNGDFQGTQPGKLNRARQNQINPTVNEDDVSKQANQRASNAGAQYKVADGSTQITQTGKLNRARQNQINPKVNETSYKSQGPSYKTSKDDPQYPKAVNNPRNS